MSGRRNLAVDPSLRSGTTDAYTPRGGATLAVTTDDGFYGKNALVITKDGSNGSGVQIAAPIPVVAGETYAFSVYTRLPVQVPRAETSEVVLAVEWVNSIGAVIASDTSAALKMDSDSTWYRVGGVWTAPPGTTFVYVSVTQPLRGTPGQKFWMDALLVELANYIGGYFDNLSTAEKMSIVNRALSAVPQVINGVRLGADIVLNDLVLNTIDEEGTVWVVTDIDGWWGQTDPELPNIPRGTEDGSYDVEGRAQARNITLSGFFIPRDADEGLSKSIDRLVKATNLIRKGGWLQAHEGPTKASWVRLSSRPQVRTVNPRGRTEFEIGLRAGDPVKYHWNDQDPDGYTNLLFQASDVIGYAENIGTAEVSGVFTLTGPAGAGTQIYNATTNQTMTLQEPLRGAGLVAEVIQAEAAAGVATLYTAAPNNLVPGDQVQLLNMVVPFSESAQPRVVTAVSEVFPYSFSFAIATDDILPVAVTGQVRLLNNDVLTIDTYNRAVTFNGNESGQRQKLTVLTDWISFDSGENVIQFLDNVTQVEVIEKQLTSNTVKLTTGDTHYFVVGETINVDLPVDAPLSRKRLTSNVVTLTTEKPHGFSVGDVINVESSESSTVITKSLTSNVVTLTTQAAHGVAVSDQITVSMPTTAALTQKQLTSNVATLTTQNAHGFSVGDGITVALPSTATISAKSLTNNQATITTSAPHGFAVGDTINVVLPGGATVTGKSRSGSQIVITTASNHGFAVGETIIMSLPETATPTGNFVGNSTTNLVTVTTSSAHGFSVGDRVRIQGSSRAEYNGEKIIETAPTSTTFTFRDWTLTSNLSTAVGSTTLLNLTNQLYNGSKTLISTSGSTFAYNL